MCKDLKHRTLYRLIILLSFLVGTLRAAAQTPITSLESITSATGHYVITADISGGTPGVATFSGTLEAAINPATHMPYRIKNLSVPLFTTLTGTVKNLVIESVTITSGTNVGAVATIAAVALHPKVIVALTREAARAGSTLEQSLRQCDAHRNAIVALLNEGSIFILVDVVIHVFTGHRQRYKVKKQ